MQQHKTVVIGASGLVAQRMQQRLSNHPWFTLNAVIGSKRTSGQMLDSIPWRLEENRPDLPNLEILNGQDECLIEQLRDCGITVAFSCVPSGVADPLELTLAEAGVAVFSNSSAFRRIDGVPLVIPDLNANHLSHFGTHEYLLACATNCTLIPLAVPTAVIAKSFGIKRVKMNSEQALSGAGFDLLLDERALAGGHAPEIAGEAEKTAQELLHVLGTPIKEQRANSSDARTHPKFETAPVHVVPADLDVEIECKRVTRKDGHQIFATLTLETDTTLEEVRNCLMAHKFPNQLKACPSAPKKAIHFVEKIDVDRHLWSDGEDFLTNPDPSHNLKTGMAVVVGHLQMLDSRTIELSAYSHNTIRGAAGGTMLLAEQAYLEQRLPKQQ